MKKAKILALFTFIFILSLTLISPVLGTQKKRSKGKSKGTANIGATIFDRECTACHAKGDNSIENEKTLKLDALKKFGFNSADDVKKRVMEGAGVMPAFKDSLKPAEIDAVSKYVWDKAQKGWK
jgi:cytochrome c6